MDRMDSMVEKFRDFSELKLYADTQFKTILLLNKTIQQLEQERDHLKNLLQNTSLTSDEPSLIGISLVSDSEIIAKTQLKKLKDSSDNGTFTLEETKKFEIFTKALVSLQMRPKTFDTKARKLDDSDLLNLLEDNSGKNIS